MGREWGDVVEDTHSLILPALINIVSTGHSMLVGTGHCPAYVKSEQA